MQFSTCGRMAGSCFSINCFGLFTGCVSGCTSITFWDWGISSGPYDVTSVSWTVGIHSNISCARLCQGAINLFIFHGWFLCGASHEHVRVRYVKWMVDRTVRTPSLLRALAGWILYPSLSSLTPLHPYSKSSQFHVLM